MPRIDGCTAVNSPADIRRLLIRVEEAISVVEAAARTPASTPPAVTSAEVEAAATGAVEAEAAGISAAEAVVEILAVEVAAEAETSNALLPRAR